MNGLGVMIGMLGGNEDTAKAVKSSIGRTIYEATLLGDKLNLVFTDNTKLQLWDDGQSCCEYRFMSTDDDLSYYTDAVLQSIEVEDGPEVEDRDGDVKEIQFLRIITNKGVITMVTHNEHNGYYGGFFVRAELNE